MSSFSFGVDSEVRSSAFRLIFREKKMVDEDLNFDNWVDQGSEYVGDTLISFDLQDGIGNEYSYG